MGRKKKEPSTVIKSMNLWGWLEQLTYLKEPWSSFSDEDKKTFDPYMVNRFVSQNKDYIDLVNSVSFIPLADKEKYYNIYRELLPRKKLWLKYIKKEKTTEYNPELIENINKYFECSSDESAEYVELLGDEGTKQVLVKLGIGEKIIKKLMK